MMIYQQGDLDNTCFLYSIANAYTALTCRSVNNERIRGWSNIIKVTPSISQFLTDGSCFYENGTKEEMIHESIVRSAFQVLSTKKYQFTISTISTDKIDNDDFLNTVVIFCVNDKAKCKCHSKLDHWMVIVGPSVA